MIKRKPESNQLCRFLFEKDGSPACFFRVADSQSCSYLDASRCYYRGGPFSHQISSPEDIPASKKEK